MKLHLPPPWIDPLEQFALHLRAGGQSENTIRTRLEDLAQIARDVGPDGPQLITGPMLVAWAGSNAWAQETRRRRRCSARAFWKWALANGYATENAAEELPAVAASRARPRPVPDRIYLPALASATPRVRLMMRLEAELGLRRAETAVVHVGHDLIVDPVSGYSLVVHGKGGAVDILPMADDLGREVERGASGHTPGEGYPRLGWLFPGKIDGHLSARWVGELVGEHLQAHQDEGELDWTGHKLRHRFGTRVYEGSGRDILTTRDALRHRSVATTQIYCAVIADAVRKAIQNAA